MSAEQAALAGDLAEAARRADAVLAGVAQDRGSTDTDTPDPTAGYRRARAARVLAAVLAHRGMLARSAELHRWAERVDPGSASLAGAIALVAIGVPGAVPDPSAVPDVPTLGAGADALVAGGVLAAVRPGGSAAALSDLTRAAASLEGGLPVLQDDSPAALGALVAMHRGESDLARGVLQRAVAADLGGAAFRRRHLLLLAWTEMAAGDLPSARGRLAAAAERPEPVETRDDLVLLGAEAGLARRAGDTGALLEVWSRGRETVLRHAVDLWSLLPLGELMITAARVGERPWLAPQVRDAEALLAALDHPALWTAPWHWRAFLAAVVADDRAEAAARGALLRETAAGEAEGSLAVVLADAADRWLEVLDGAVDADAVGATAAAMRAAGLAHDAARLAKEAAVRTPDRRTMTSLLGVARSVLPAASPTAVSTAVAAGGAPEEDDADPAAPPASLPAGAARSGNPLSGRECEVAALLLEGMTHRQIGDRLFISAKTVEHHVGRIRQRLGSGSRTELFADLRAALAS